MHKQITTTILNHIREVMNLNRAKKNAEMFVPASMKKLYMLELRKLKVKVSTVDGDNTLLLEWK